MMAHRVLVTGGRDYANRNALTESLTTAWLGCELDELACGGATGADALAIEWAKNMQIPYHVWPAQWTLLGKAAGPSRNKQMLAEFQPTLVIAFPGGRGTAHMVRIAKDAGVQVMEVPA
jgi:hypothetical protein